MEDYILLALETLQKNKQAFIFAPTRSSAEKTAEELAKLSSQHQPMAAGENPPKPSAALAPLMQQPELAQGVLKALSSPTKQCRRLAACVQKGIAFHHAGLVAEQRELIEEQFRKGNIKIICATPTLAAGLSMPAFRVIIKSLKRYSAAWGQDWIPVLEYLQMAGRAGRPEYEPYGEALAIARDEGEKHEIYERYICGVPEEITSKLAVEPVLRTYLLSLIAGGFITDEESMRQFFGKTFWAHAYGDMLQLYSKLAEMQELLQEWGFIRSSSSGEEFVPANRISLSRMDGASAPANRLRPTPLGKRISELYLDPLTARHILDGLENFAKRKAAAMEKKRKEQERYGESFPFLHLLCWTLEMRPLLSVRKREEDIIQEKLTERYGLLLLPEPAPYGTEYGDFLSAVKTALFLEEWGDEKDEDYLLEKYDIRPGEIRAKLEIADWLLYAASELARLTESTGSRDAVPLLAKLRMRVKYGAKEELLPLLRLRGIGRVRARKLYNSGIKDIGFLKKMDLATLRQLIGNALANDVKKQLGEELPEEVSPYKRKGQLSIGKYG